MEHRVPPRDLDIKAPYLAQNGVRKGKAHDDDLKHRRELHRKALFNERRGKKQKKRCHAQHGIFKISPYKCKDKRHYHDKAEYDINGEDCLVFLYLSDKIKAGSASFQLFFVFHQFMFRSYSFSKR